MLGAAEIAAMKPGAHLINASRGTVVDIDAWPRRWRRTLGGAAVDVFRSSPGQRRSVRVAAARMDNVILTPHVGGSTLEAQDNIGVEVAAKLVRYSDNGRYAVERSTPRGHKLPAPRRQPPHQAHPPARAAASCPVNEYSAKQGHHIDGQFCARQPRRYV
jgi:D-3-phosphoglycerate dehydrogenase